MQRRFLAVLAMLTFVVTLLFASAAGAQESDETEATSATEGNEATVEAQAQKSSGPLVFAEGEQTGEVQAAATTESGALRGKEVETRSTDGDRRVELMLIPFPNGCKLVENKVSFILEDDDGTQADFIEGNNPTNSNIQVKRDGDVLRVKSNAPTSGTGDPDIVPFNERGGDEQLDTGGLTIVASTGIKCESENAGDGDGNTGGDSSPPPDGTSQVAQNPADGSTVAPTAAENPTTASPSAADAGAEATTGDAAAEAGTGDGNVRGADAFRCELFLRVVRDEQGALLDQYQNNELIVQRFEQCLAADVLNDTIPNRNLPFTGGPAGVLFLGAALGLVSIIVGTSVLRAGLRRGR